MSTIGWTGSYCNESCSPGFYGVNCSSKCNNCLQPNSCDRFSGECECMTGWKGTKCNEPCELGKFGMNCSNSCDCQKSLCNPIDGTCICEPGWYGQNCEKMCEKGQFGPVFIKILMLL